MVLKYSRYCTGIQAVARGREAAFGLQKCLVRLLGWLFESFKAGAEAAVRMFPAPGAAALRLVVARSDSNRK